MKSSPPEFTSIGFMGDFTSADGKSWRGPCPRCGGHRRFLVFTDRPYPHWNYSCSLCEYQGFVDQMVGARPAMTDEEVQDWKAREEQERLAKQQRVEHARASFLESKLWDQAWVELRYDKEAQNWWFNRGLPDDWQRHWVLGVTTRNFAYKDASEEWQQLKHKTYTIPKFVPGQPLPVSMDFRLSDPVPDPLGKYMSMPHLPPALFYCDLENPLGNGRVLVVEGAIKAMVTYVWSGLVGWQVLAVPAARSWCNLVQLLQGTAEQVYVCLDPDAVKPAKDLVEELGPKARRVSLPVKIDDAFIRHGLTQQLFETILKQARR